LPVALAIGDVACRSVMAATLLVTNCNDAGNGSLRAALATAQSTDLDGEELTGIALCKAEWPGSTSGTRHRYVRLQTQSAQRERSRVIRVWSFIATHELARLLNLGERKCAVTSCCLQPRCPHR
jgi:hypothetical protein